MRCPGIVLFLALIACLFIAGCTQVSGTAVATPQPTTAAVTPVPVEVTTAVPTAAPADTPEAVVTIVHYIPLTKDIKDSKLLFSLQVPVEWTPSTYRLEKPENYEGFMYQTDLLKNNTFYIHTYENYRTRD